MDTTKRESAVHQAIRLAYQHKKPSLPGRLFDVTVIGLFLVTAVAYFVT